MLETRVRFSSAPFWGNFVIPLWVLLVSLASQFVIFLILYLWNLRAFMGKELANSMELKRKVNNAYIEMDRLKRFLDDKGKK